MDWVAPAVLLILITVMGVMIIRLQNRLDHTHHVAHTALAAIIMHTQGADIITRRLAEDGTPLREDPEE